MTDKAHIKLGDELFASAESSCFDGQLEKPIFVSGADTYTFGQPLSWNVCVSNTGGALLVTGVVTGQATIDCARCLKPFSLHAEGALEGYFVIPGQTHDIEDLEEDEFDVLADDNCIDLEPLIDAALLLALPLIPLCDEDCKGLCHTCGINLNESSCSCKPTEAEESPQDNPFAVLKKLDLGNQ